MQSGHSPSLHVAGRSEELYKQKRKLFAETCDTIDAFYERVYLRLHCEFYPDS